MKTTGLNFIEALDLIEKGKRVRRSVWLSDVYACLAQSETNPIAVIFAHNIACTPFTITDYKATDWIEVEVKEEEE